MLSLLFVIVRNSSSRTKCYISIPVNDANRVNDEINWVDTQNTCSNISAEASIPVAGSCSELLDIYNLTRRGHNYLTFWLGCNAPTREGWRCFDGHSSWDVHSNSGYGYWRKLK